MVTDIIIVQVVSLFGNLQMQHSNIIMENPMNKVDIHPNKWQKLLAL